MLLSQELAGFTKGQADSLRKAMGKKIQSLMDELKPLFMEGTAKNEIKTETAEKIWNDWAKFAEYAFNKSHSTCYALLAYHTAYLKRHYPEEFMASVLTHNMKDIKKIAFFMEECKKMKLDVLGPDVNESNIDFAVNKEGAIRFALSAIKGVGSNVAECIVEERTKGEPFTSIFDMAKRMSSNQVNKRGYESLAYAGAFDSFEGIHRSQYFTVDAKDGLTGIEKAIKFSSSYHATKIMNQASLFGADAMPEVRFPELPQVEPWSSMVRLNHEKDVIGMFISGHPLNEYKVEIAQFCNASLDRLEAYKDREFKIAVIVTASRELRTKKGDPFGIITIEDFSDSTEIRLYGSDYAKFKGFFAKDNKLFLTCIYKQGWGQNSDYRLEIISVVPMEEMMAKAKRITLEIPSSIIDANFIQKMDTVFEENKGTVQVYIKVSSSSGKYEVDLFSRKHVVKTESALLEWIHSYPDIIYRIV